MTHKNNNLKQQLLLSKSQQLDIELKAILQQFNSFIMRRINYISQNDFEKDDLYQEVLIKIYLALERHHFQYDDSFIKYISQLIKSVKCDYYRRHYTQQKRYTNVVNDAVVEYQTNLLNRDRVEREILTCEAIKLLNTACEKLTKQEREVFEFYSKGYKPKEIAHLLGIKDKVVYNAIQRCKMKIRHHLEYKLK
ncbi:MAG: sigma-70 family RNA polymerase sigma factor [Staphylococcus warneri]|uniref:sigma-70 family RNA polymerase sigma factor n=1 Tax=Staphylococcus warneri TaxID=1292 RepID=UPI0009A47A0C|nr:sigma-70 family RNA polymerase sigma factor [Staphylococcus warneri]MCM3482805.1 sigma-70 family RNA polymerase sigma factor [Staphylococcus warneri]MCR4501308.1 sigma-70 family RNA polymerase sigma factor [Staphylococcus warneri]MCT1632817.1 sigma-70 family RNA polymerase sigma factor [Staphylococcus warneri]MCT2347706.1 sigma-70 family RNA polymerase sigma factor [Staphylococcus warneri]MCV7477223.1 sigma-70 family RNA polymerase sigma factor [Staphylococcus warneri]